MRVKQVHVSTAFRVWGDLGTLSPLHSFPGPAPALPQFSLQSQEPGVPAAALLCDFVSPSPSLSLSFLI